ncbi:hypothetical protein GALL_458950 [mine drainage metagenome]|uniref:Uncharacterized protein n=1 Tax=mine drainage metagenome TaxID=410659 RepID=A0A1J5PXD5_9ZZZZ
MQEKHRHEHDADAEQRHEGRHHDLLRAVQDRRADVLALLQVPVDVLDRHRGFVDENTNRERQAAERHDVEGFAEGRQHDDGAEHGERNRRCDDDGRTPASQEQKNHHAREQGRDHTFAHHAGDGGGDEQPLVADKTHLQRLWKRVLEVDDLLLDAGDDVERRNVTRLQHHHQNGTIAVDMDDVGLRRIAVAHGRDVPDIDRGAIDDLDRETAEFVDLQRRIVDLNDIFEATDLRGACRLDQVLRRKRVGDVLTRESQRLQRRRIDVDLDLTLLAAIGIRDRRAGHGDQRRAQLIDGDIGKHLFGEAFTGQRELDDRNRRGAVIEDQRRRRPGGHLLDDRLRNRGDLGVGGADIGVGLKEDLDDADAVIGIRGDVLDIVDGRRQDSLVLGNDAARHLIRRQARILPDHPDHRDSNVRKDIGRRAHRGERANDQEKQREHDECVWPAQGDTDQCSHKAGIPGSISRIRGLSALVYPNCNKMANVGRLIRLHFSDTAMRYVPQFPLIRQTAQIRDVECPLDRQTPYACPGEPPRLRPPLPS